MRFCDRCVKINPRENFQILYFEKSYTKKVVLTKNLREIARKLIPNFELLCKVRENKSARKFLIFAQTKCAKICPLENSMNKVKVYLYAKFVKGKINAQNGRKMNI